VGFITFLHCLRVEMPFRCKQASPREKCLLDLPGSVLHHVGHWDLKGSLPVRFMGYIPQAAERNSVCGSDNHSFHSTVLTWSQHWGRQNRGKNYRFMLT
jgi:hypothetical protein